jgi:glutamine amidotransferase
MIVIIDYGMGNLGSIKNIIKKIGYESIISNDKSIIQQAEKLILPGVGNFKEAMQNLNKTGLIDTLNKKILTEKTPILGICLGMQLMTSHSEEGDVIGLNWINANTKKFIFSNNNIKIPHMGWNNIKIMKENKLNENFEAPCRFYFVHSYHVICNDSEDILHNTNYFIDFTSAFNRDNIYGVQYHPEKSHQFGFQLLKNFIELC